MTKNKILYPSYFQIVRFDGEAWYFKHAEKFYNPERISIPEAIDLAKIDKLACFDTNHRKLIMEFRLINGGQIGYYLADLKNAKYYYCGSHWEDISTTLRSLGIGRENPND